MSEHPDRPPRTPSRRAVVVLALAMLAIGVAAGAAIGPAPTASFAGVSPGLLQKLPELLAAIAGRSRAASQAQSASGESQQPAGEEEAPKRRRRRRVVIVRAPQSAEETQPSETTAATTTPSVQKGATGAKLPAISDVWLIELDGESFSATDAQPAAAPYITGTLLGQGALLGGWSSLQASALAGEAALLAPVPLGGTPPIVHSIVQPACPEGAAGAACSSPTGALSAADAFAKETLASITGTSAYREHGLVIITFASVGLAAQQGLPAGASSATLTEKPPAGVLVLSPFAKAGSRPSLHFDPTSPAQSLRALLG